MDFKGKVDGVSATYATSGNLITFTCDRGNTGAEDLNYTATSDTFTLRADDVTVAFLNVDEP